MGKDKIIQVCDVRLTLWGTGQSRLVLGNMEEGLNFILNKGEHTVIFGANGAGKSTLLKLLRGEAFVDPNGGSVSWFTEEGEENAPLAGRAMCALVSAALQEKYMRQGWDISGTDLLLTGFGDTPLIYTLPEIEQKKKVEKIAEELGISSLLTRAINTLSQGQLRILLLARALIYKNGPQVLLLDEYTDGLDVQTRKNLLDFLEEKAQHCTIIMTSHRRDTVPPWIKRHLFLENGILKEDLPPVFGGNKSKSALTFTEKSQEKSPASLPLVDITNASVYVEGVLILQNINWTWQKGEHWLIHGGNGAGKSTFLQLLAGEQYPALGGSISRNMPSYGNSVELKLIQKAMPLVSDKLQATYGYNLTALELVLSGFENSIGLYRSFTEEEKAQGIKSMKTFRVEKLLKHPINTLSTGQMRKLLLARALMSQPDILLLDEACSGLDAYSRQEVLEILQSLTEGSKPLHLLLVSHHIEDYVPVINRQAFMDKGRLYPD